VRGLLADVNCEGQFDCLRHAAESGERGEYWNFLELVALKVADVGLDAQSSDREIWRFCQDDQLVLITTNRNAKGPDSLQAVLDELNGPASLPVLTIADSKRLMRDRRYAEQAADRVLQYLFDMDRYRGTGRLFVP
jgi:hypothetical protein